MAGFLITAMDDTEAMFTAVRAFRDRADRGERYPSWFTVERQPQPRLTFGQAIRSIWDPRPYSYRVRYAAHASAQEVC